MRSIASTENYICIDNSGTPGIPEEVAVSNGLPTWAARGKYEAAMYVCSHCQTMVIKNPDRMRDRVVCKGCSKVICDDCSAALWAGAPCKPWQAKIDEALEAADKHAGSSILIAR